MRRSLVTSLLVVASVVFDAAALGAPPLPEPPIPPPDPAQPASDADPPPNAKPTPAPKKPPASTPAPAPSLAPKSPPGSPPPADTKDDAAFAPPPNLEKNPIDALPGDVVYPPHRDRVIHRVIWNPEWPRFGTTDWIITGAAAAVTLTAAIIPPQRKHAFGGVLFDDDARRVLRVPTNDGRYIARDASDIILSLEATWPFFVDALITTWWYRGSPDAAAQMALVNGQALAIVTAVQGATNTIASRERPYGRICGTPERPNETIDCEGNVRYRSFFSGHAAFTFMSAGLICVHHQKLDLLDGAGDTIACVAGYAGAAATATLRVMGDMHYISDVTVGAAMGTLVGLAVPLFHYRRVNLAPKNRGAGNVDWTVIPIGAGLGVGGTF